MEGEDEDTGDERGFVRQSAPKKLLILASGCIMNFISGVCILLVLYSGAAGFRVDTVSGLAPEFTKTGENGIEVGDRIYKVDGYRTFFSGDAQLFLSYADDTVDIVVIRDGQKIRVEDLSRQTCTGMDGTTYTGFGLYVGASVVPATLGVRLQYTWYQALDFVQMVWFSLAELLSGGATMNDMSGPVGIVSTITEIGTSAETRWDAWFSVFYFAALLSVNLAVMNLLPIPALDGGRILFLLVDLLAMLLFKRNIPEKYQAAVNTAGLAVLLGLMALLTFKDVFQILR